MKGFIVIHALDWEMEIDDIGCEDGKRNYS